MRPSFLKITVTEYKIKISGCFFKILAALSSINGTRLVYAVRLRCFVDPFRAHKDDQNCLLSNFVENISQCKKITPYVD